MSYDHYYEQACEYVVPVRLVVPLFIEPKVFTQSVYTRERIQIALEPEILLEPEVRAKQTACIPQNGYHKPALTAESLD